jgi:DNA-binding transcriptional ArsR family regulator
VAEQISIAAFRALADPTRLKILELLRGGEELCVSNIAEHFKMTQPSISHHLSVLRRAGLVMREKRGREVYYRFSREAIVDCCGEQFRLFDLEIRLCEGPQYRALMVKKRSARKG